MVTTTHAMVLVAALLAAAPAAFSQTPFYTLTQGDLIGSAPWLGPAAALAGGGFRGPAR